MAKITFIIKYRDPETQEEVTEEVETEDGGGLSALDWAEDYAYRKADKGRYTIVPKGGWK